MTESKIAFKSEYGTNKSTVSSLAVLLIFYSKLYRMLIRSV